MNDPTPTPLKTPLLAEVQKDLTLKESAPDPDLQKKADHYVKTLIELDPTEQAEGKTTVEWLGLDIQQKAAKQMGMLKQPIKDLSARGDDKGNIGKSLIDLKIKVEELDPGKFDFEPGWFSRTLGRLPGVGTPIKRYFTKYESAQTVIGAIVRSLEQGKDQLIRDNVTLAEDQNLMRETGKKIEQLIQLGHLMDQKLQYKLDREIPNTDPKSKYVSEELLFPLRQRLMDLQQQLAVHQQGVLAAEIIIRNNKELIRGVNRALHVTITALEVGATVALALANQKIVLEKIDAVNKTTSDLIASTASRLKTQGVEIHKKAASAQLNIESLKSAFTDITSAIEDLSRFRQEALPQMATTILDLDKVTGEAEKAIQTLERGNKARPKLALE